MVHVQIYHPGQEPLAVVDQSNKTAGIASGQRNCQGTAVEVFDRELRISFGLEA